jgi:hypothetical protein
MTTSESMVYRVLLKCACSSIGQIMYYSDHGRFFDGDIHDAKADIHKWAIDKSQPLIAKTVSNHSSYTFTCVRNPYTRILSSFFDKICGIQCNGKYYRGNLVPLLVQKYGIEVGDPDNGFDFDQIESFRRFLLFARDIIRWRRPMEPDIHWSAMSGHISTFIVNGGPYDKIFWTEKFNDGMQDVLDNTNTAHAIDLATVPRFNEGEGHGPNGHIPSPTTSITSRCIWSTRCTKMTSIFLNMILKPLQTKCLSVKSILRKFTQSLVSSFH